MTQSAIEKALASPAGMVLEKLRAELGGRWLEPGDDPDRPVRADQEEQPQTHAVDVRRGPDQERLGHGAVPADVLLGHQAAGHTDTAPLPPVQAKGRPGRRWGKLVR